MSEDRELEQRVAAKAIIRKYIDEHFAPLWEKVGAHAMIGGAVRTFWNAETQSIDMECIYPEDMWPPIGFVTHEAADANVAKMLSDCRPFFLDIDRQARDE